MTPPRPFGIYLHWPFCRAKCPYCDFNVHLKGKGSLSDENVAALLLEELHGLRALIGARRVGSVYWGGGTPSLMAPRMGGAMLEAIAATFSLEAGAEITLEANPEDIDEKSAVAWRAAGITRLSLGAQAFRSEALRFLGRAHSPQEARAAIMAAKRVFPRVSFDLIYGRPRQTLASWREELEEALALIADFPHAHFSLYQLTIEKGARFFAWRREGRFPMPSDDHAADLYEMTQELCERAGLPAYEISNHARNEEARSRHNLLYWQSGEYAGLGAGAHGRLHMEGGRYATVNPLPPRIWAGAVRGEGRVRQTRRLLSLEEEAEERIFMGLRLREGFALEPLRRMGAMPSEDSRRFFREAGLIEETPTRLRARPAGRLLLDRIARDLCLAMKATSRASRPAPPPHPRP